MQQTQEEPLHWDNHRTKLNLTFIFALVVAVFGILGQPALFVIGIGVAIYSWLTNPKQYLIYPDSLVIIYGRPRVKSYPFQDMAHLELLTLPIGDRLRVRMVNGSRIMLLTKDSDTFRAKLDEALEAFHSGQAGSDFGQNGNSVGYRSDSPMVIEGEALSEVEAEHEILEPEIMDSEIIEETPPKRRTGESSTENDDVPY
jgi:hypothetical protein